MLIESMQHNHQRSAVTQQSKEPESDCKHLSNGIEAGVLDYDRYPVNHGQGKNHV